MQLRSLLGRRARRRAVGMGVVAGMAAGLLAVTGLTGTSGAQITTPAADSVIRDEGPVTIHEDRGGQYATLGAATTLNSALLGRGCNNADPARRKANATITVTRESDNTVVHSAFHETDNNLLSLSTANASGAFSTTWDTTGAAPGLYRIKSTVNDRAKVNSTTCTPDTNVVLSDFTVEFRPWQHSNFNDLLGYGKVRMNSVPAEFQYTVDGSTSAIVAANPNQLQFYSSPEGLLLLPSDPSGCADDPASCLPAAAVPCNPSAGCTPRLALANYSSGGETLFGVFDLDTGAFAAYASTGGKTRLLVSAGTELDAIVADLIAQVAAGGQEATGIELLNLLSTTVEIRSLLSDGNIQTIEVGILRGLQISRVMAAPDAVNGISLLAPFTLNAGFITHTVGAHSYSQADGDPSVFTVTKSPLVPNVPTLFSVPLGGLGSLELVAPVPVPAPANAVTGDLLLVGGGPLVNIYGTYPDGTGSHTVGTSSTGPSVDTAPNAPSGLPAWLPGFDGGTIEDEGPIDFVGHAALFLDLPDICLLGTCFELGIFTIAQGVTVFGDSPLPPLASLPLLWDTDNPAAAELNELTSNLALELLTNPAVGQVLSAALVLLGGGTPDLATVTGVLSDLGTFTDLIDAVAGTAGLEAVPGLEDALNELGVVTEVVPLPEGGGDPISALLGSLLGALAL